MVTLLLKEVRGFLSSLIGYIVITVFLLINGLFYRFDNNFISLGIAIPKLDGTDC